MTKATIVTFVTLNYSQKKNDTNTIYNQLQKCLYNADSTEQTTESFLFVKLLNTFRNSTLFLVECYSCL